MAMAKHYGPIISQAYIDKLETDPYKIMDKLLKECFKKITPAKNITADNIKNNFDKIESYIYTVFSIETGLTVLPEDAIIEVAYHLIEWALKIPDRKLARKFIASFEMKIVRHIIKLEEWDKANGNKYQNRYVRRKSKWTEFYKQPAEQLTIKTDFMDNIVLINPLDIKTEDECKCYGETLKQYIVNETNQNKLKTNLHKIWQWLNTIHDNKLCGTIFATIISYEPAKIRILSSESWSFIATLLLHRIK